MKGYDLHTFSIFLKAAFHKFTSSILEYFVSLSLHVSLIYLVSMFLFVLNHFIPIFSFHTPWKQAPEKQMSFDVFKGIERDQWNEMN